MELIISEKNNISRIINKVDESFSKIEKQQLRDQIVEDIYGCAERIASKNVRIEGSRQTDWGEKVDDILTSKWLGFPIMLLLLGGVFWLTIIGANYPSAMLSEALFWVEDRLTEFFTWTQAPEWLYGVLVMGVYRTMAWVVSVMLPPMAIFFPLFTLMEDLGYLPRVAFNLDNFFKRAGTHGKQSLTMSMGFGCNAAGVIAARIIVSPREKLIAILTNNFVPCNGRFPTLIILATIFMGNMVNSAYSSFVAAAVVVGIVLVGIIITLLVSWGLSKTFLKGVPSSFTLELPPYRKPQIGKILVRSFLDRTLFVLERAVMIAAPAGVFVWIFANTGIGGISLINYVANILDPFAVLIGLDGIVLLAFILGFPANEIVIPIIVMSYLSAGAMLEPDSAEALREILVTNGWTWITALSTMLFSLLHFPCGTTLLTIRKETESLKWPVFSFLLTTTIAIVVNFLVVQLIHLF